MPEVQHKASRTKGLDLPGILDIAAGYERVRLCVNNLKGATTNEGTIHYASAQDNDKSRYTGYKQQDSSLARTYDGKNKHGSQSTQCGSCGNDPHTDDKQCRAIGKQCGNCDAYNHLRKVCPQPPRLQQSYNSNKRNTFKGNNGSQNQHGAYKGNNGPHKNNYNQQSHNSNGNFNKNKKVYAIDTKHNETPNTTAHKKMDVDEEEFAEFIRYKTLLNYRIIKAITTDRPRINRIELSSAPKVTVKFFETHVKMMVDTGAPINVLDEVTYQQLRIKPKLEKCETKFYGYTSSTPLELMGEFKAKVEFNTRAVEGWFVVVRSGQWQT